MKRSINACVRVTIALLFSGIAIAAPAPVENEQIAQLLDQLGVRALLEQAPAIFAAAAEAQTQFSPTQVSSGQAASTNWRRDLETQLKPQQLLSNVTHYLREHYRADKFQQTQQRLQEPLAKRARYFDLAMTQPGAEKNLRDFMAQHKSATSGAESANAESTGSETRRAVLRDIDTANATSLLTATLQSAIAARVRQAANGGAVDAALLKDEIAERQRYLAPLAADYLFYDYRYLRDDELRDYRDLLRDDAVQTVLDLSRQAILNAIVGELTPPTAKPPS